MTVLITLERELDLAERLTVIGSEHSRHIKRGMSVTRHELINLALVASDNLAANTLSETSGVDKHEFISLMNYRAKSLNMPDTRYFDPVGMSPFNVSTVYDIKTLTQHLERYPLFSENASATTIQVTPTNKNRRTTVTARNTNVFAGKLNILAAKTGFTNSAGRCLTMLFTADNNHKYVLVVLGATNNAQRQKMVKQLLDSIR
jgi:D-alanyl-D-alanine endopeptidase (penicillin-binding protein 7)